MEAILERVKDVIGEQLGIEDLDTITMETTFIDDLNGFPFPSGTFNPSDRIEMRHKRRTLE